MACMQRGLIVGLSTHTVRHCGRRGVRHTEVPNVRVGNSYVFYSLKTGTRLRNPQQC